MAHAALVSLQRTLNSLSHSRFKAPYPQLQIKTLCENLSSLQCNLELIFPVTRKIKGPVSDLESKIRDAVFESQDEIEEFVKGRVLSPQSDQVTGDLQKIIASFNPMAETAKKLAEDAKNVKLGTQESDEAISSKFTSRSKKFRIIGQEEDFRLVTEELRSQTDDLQIVPIIGMPGIGKTTLARSIYEDRRMEDEFLARAWVTVSPEYNFRDIFTKLLASIETRGQKGDDSVSANKLGVSRESDEQLAQRLYQALFDTRYLVVIDDMWVGSVWDKLKQYFPDNKNRSRIILTTRHEHIAKYAKHTGFHHKMKPLNPENSWILLCDRAFGDGNCPPYLELTGRKIADNCKGLPLSLTVIGGQLSQERKTVEYWIIIEQDIHAAAASAENPEEPYLEILNLSYTHLPSRLKGCFLYMGGFPEDYEIPLSKLIRLWVAEGFLQYKDGEILEFVARKFLEELIDRNLIMIRKFGPDGRIKCCGIHDILRDIAVEECVKEKFFHGIKRYSEPLPKGADTQRRLSVHKNILMCMEEVYNAAKKVMCARSFLFAGNHHHHPYPFTLDFNYLRVLDALTVYFIEFPDEVFNMIHLSYLSLTYNGKLPSPITKLLNLQVLIVRQYPKIIYLGTSLLPDDIWKMPQLRHLFCTETELPKLSGVEFLAKDSVLLRHLQSLSNVNAACLNLTVLGQFPNLTKLETWLAAPDAIDFHINKLGALEVFKLTVLNPAPGKRIAFQPSLSFPKMLRKLSLSGCGIRWEDMTIIGQLEYLEVLKLREFAFLHTEEEKREGEVPEEEDREGEVPEEEEEDDDDDDDNDKEDDDKEEEEEPVSVWAPKSGEFLKLKYLLLEALDFDRWVADDTHFRSLETLIIRHCYNLVEIPEEIGDIGPLELIEMVDCSPTAVESARAIKKKQADNNPRLQVRIYSSWE